MCWVLVGKVEYVSSPLGLRLCAFRGLFFDLVFEGFWPGLLALLSLFLGLMVPSFHGFVALEVYCLDCWVYNFLGVLVNFSIFFIGLLRKDVELER